MNPFLNRKVIRDPTAFHDRQLELGDIYSLVASMQTCSVVGPRRIGKSSLLYQLTLPQRYQAYLPEPEKYLFTYLDLQELAGLGPDDFFLTIVNRLQRLGSDKLRLDPEKYGSLGGFRRLLADITESGLRLVVCCDEFEMLSKNALFGVDFFTSLRGLSSNYNFVLITASRTSLFELCHIGNLQTSEFWNIFIEKRLGLMPEKSCRDMIRESFISTGNDVTPEEIDFLLDVAGPHPFFLQIAAAFLFEQKTSGEAVVMGAVSDKYYQEAHRHFVYSLQQISEKSREALIDMAASPKPRTLPAPTFNELNQQALVRGSVQEAAILSAGLRRYILEEHAPAGTASGGGDQIPVPAVPKSPAIKSEAQKLDYKDFEIKVERITSRSCRALVTDSPAGQTDTVCNLPFDLDELGEVIINLGRQASRGQVEHKATAVTPITLGEGLYNAIFSGAIGELFSESLGEVRSKGQGLRIKVHVNPDDSPHLASLPWEFLYNARKRSFLGLNRFTPIIRYLDVQAKTTLESIDAPLRVLVVISSPQGLPALDLKTERNYIEKAWGNYHEVQVHFLDEATPAELQSSLWDFKPHVLHFMGHGFYNSATGMGELFFVDEAQQPKPVTGRQLGVLLANTPSMKLAVLNACQTAQLSRSNELDPFSGVAAAIVMSGLPAVVAMQFPISDRAALVFANKFYSRLILGDAVDVAVAFGREALHLELSESHEWGTPVLFMRVPHGKLFEFKRGSE
jgi:hypothetical protein